MVKQFTLRASQQDMEQVEIKKQKVPKKEWPDSLTAAEYTNHGLDGNDLHQAQ